MTPNVRYGYEPMFQTIYGNFFILQVGKWASSTPQRLRIAGSCISGIGTAMQVTNAVKKIDHILVSTRWRILQNCKVFWSAEFCSTD